MGRFIGLREAISKGQDGGEWSLDGRMAGIKMLEG